MKYKTFEEPLIYDDYIYPEAKPPSSLFIYPLIKNMKNLLILLSFMCATLTAQTPYYIMKPVYLDNGTNQVRVSGVSIKNTWLGSKLTLALNDDGLLRDNFVFSAKVLYTPIFGEKYAIPVVTSTALNSTNLFNAESGVNIGVYPYYVLKESAKQITVLHGGIGYKVVPKTDDILVQEQVKLMVGAELMFYQEGFAAPTSISLSPIYWHNFNSDDYLGIELTGILPIGVDMGVLAEYWNTFNGIDGFRIGLIVNSL